MNVSDITIRLIILLIPGAIAALVIDNLTFHCPWTKFSFIVYSVLLGFASYIFHQLISYGLGFILPFVGIAYTPTSLYFWASLFNKTIPISFREIAITSFLAIATGYIMSALINHKLLYKTAKLFRVSMKFGDEDLWGFLLRSPETTWVWLRDHSRGLIYEGYVSHVSITTPFREIVLREVKVFSNGDGTFLYDVPAMYICSKPTDITIELPILVKEEVNHGRERSKGCIDESRITGGIEKRST